MKARYTRENGWDIDLLLDDVTGEGMALFLIFFVPISCGGLAFLIWVIGQAAR